MKDRSVATGVPVFVGSIWKGGALELRDAINAERIAREGEYTYGARLSHGLGTLPQQCKSILLSLITTFFVKKTRLEAPDASLEAIRLSSSSGTKKHRTQT